MNLSESLLAVGRAERRREVDGASFPSELIEIATDIADNAFQIPQREEIRRGPSTNQIDPHRERVALRAELVQKVRIATPIVPTSQPFPKTDTATIRQWFRTL